MQQIPSIWREELTHPLVVHFPIALLVSLPLCLALFFFFYQKKSLQTLITFNLGLGVFGSWIAIYTGDTAEGVVNRVICDPTVTHLHSDWAYYSAYIFTALLIIWGIRYFIALPIDRLVVGFLTVLSIAGASTMIYTGHLGASLVYQQGAGVYHPSPECTEFE